MLELSDSQIPSTIGKDLENFGLGKFEYIPAEFGCGFVL